MSGVISPSFEGLFVGVLLVAMATLGVLSAEVGELQVKACATTGNVSKEFWPVAICDVLSNGAQGLFVLLFPSFACLLQTSKRRHRVKARPTAREYLYGVCVYVYVSCVCMVWSSV